MLKPSEIGEPRGRPVAVFWRVSLPESLEATQATFKAQSDWRADLLACDGNLIYLRVGGDLGDIYHDLDE